MRKLLFISLIVLTMISCKKEDEPTPDLTGSYIAVSLNGQIPYVDIELIIQGGKVYRFGILIGEASGNTGTYYGANVHYKLVGNTLTIVEVNDVYRRL